MRSSLRFALLFLATPALAETPHPLNADDLIAFDRVSAPAVSPDGRRVVFTVSALDLEANKRRSDLYIADVKAGGARRFTSHRSAHDAAFSPDGKWIYFLSSRGDKSELWRISPDGGEAEPVTHLPLDIGSFAIAPDGAHLIVSLEVFPDCKDLDCTQKRLAESAADKSSGHIYDQLFMRHWDEWADGRRSHLFALPINGQGAPIDLMPGMQADSPSKPFGGNEDFTFTPDARAVVLSARDAGREEAWSTNFDLFVAPIDGSTAPRSLTAANQAWDTAPLFSPDGKTLVYLAMTHPGYEADRRRIIVRDWQRGSERILAAAWDRSPDELVFSRDGKTLYATADDLGNKGLFAIDIQSGKVKTLVDKGHVTAPRVAGDEVIFSWDEFRHPAELQRIKSSGPVNQMSAITTLNAARLANIKMGEPEPFTFSGAGGDTVHAWLVKPVDFQPGNKYPIAYLIHGGPQGSFSNNFHYRWNAEFYAAAGYAAILVDFHGSTGYGQAFTDSIGGDWGGKPFIDLQKGLEAATRKYSFLDGDRACALGASFGGYMINWIAGNWPDRFRCLVVHDGNLDERMAYFDTEELWFPEWDHKGNPWDNPDNYNKHNPIDFVKNWKTPTLVIHGGRDYRVVDTQGMSTFTALQRRHVPSRFLYFPDENHWVIHPANSLLWHKTVLDWLDRYTKGKAPIGAAK